MASTYIKLPLTGGGGGGGGAVDSFNGRVGTVLPQSGDYTASQVTNTPSGNISSTNVQNALNELDTEKQAVITGGASTIASSNLTASKALVSDVSGKVATSSVTSTELSFSSGVTSSIQTQLNAKEPTISVLPISRGGTGATTTPGVISSLQIIEYNTFSNADFIVPSTYALIKTVTQIGAMTAPRTVTLPPANSLPGGVSITVTDVTGTVTPTNRLIVSPGGGDTINGSATAIDVRRSYSTLSFSTNGVSNWTMSVDSISTGGTGIDTRPTNGQLLIGNTSTGRYDLTSLTAGAGISITPGAGSITITNTYASGSINLDGGQANSIYGGGTPIDGGNA
jgi:hypothetical protein